MATKLKLGYLETTLDFDERYFHLAEDCVGAVVHFSFRGKRYVICFPNFDFAKLSAFGHPQPTADNTKIGLDWLSHKRVEGNDYGSEFTHNPQTKTVLGFNANRLIVRSRGPITSAQAQEAKKVLPTWRNLFADWLEATEYTDMTYNGVTVEQPDNIQAYFIPKDKPKTSRRLKSGNPLNYVISTNIQNGIEKKSLMRALKLASTGQSPPGYYQQITSALKYFHNNDYRQCVLDAATAFEMAMTQILDTRLKELTPIQRKLIEDKYVQIVGLSDSLRKLGVLMPTKADIQTKIAEPRNSAIHRGKTITKVVAQDALSFVKDFIYTQLPIK